MQISDYLDATLITFLEEKSRNKAITKLVSLLDQKKLLPNAKIFHKAILKREKIVSTGVGMGVAFPHAKQESLQDFFIAIGIQKKRGLEWKSLDGAPVYLIFMIGGY